MASSRFANASSTVAPWLAVPVSGLSEQKPPEGSDQITAVSCIGKRLGRFRKGRRRIGRAGTLQVLRLSRRHLAYCVPLRGRSAAQAW